MATAKKSARKSAKTTAPEIEPEAAARNRQNAANRAAGKGDTTRNHDANPDVSTDSSVRHAEPPDGRRDGSGHGGYPSGEYDVTPPKLASAKTKGPTATAVGQLYANSPEAERAVAQAKQHARLAPAEFDKAVEALPVGTVIEHEGPNRWRVHVAGQPRYGHGGTHSEAVESYILGGESVTAEQQAAERFRALPARQQREIRERDRQAAEAVGGTDSASFIRSENAKAAEADRHAEPPAPNAATDGPEKASARDEAGRAGTEAASSTDSGYTSDAGRSGGGG